MKIVFFGSDDFAEAHLRRLVESNHKVLALVTQPDRPKGRGMKIVSSPIKKFAQSKRIAVLQPASLKDISFVKKLEGLKSDLFVVIAYGKLLPDEILNMAQHGAINVHASLLPKYRGAAPINWTIINGEKETGISIIKLNEKMDAGDILSQMKIKIENDETAASLREKMICEGPAFLLKVIGDLAGYFPKKQDDRFVTNAPKITRATGRIDWTKSASEIRNLICGLYPKPGAYTFYEKKLLRILKAKIVKEDLPKSEPATVKKISKEGIIISTKDKGLLIQNLHLQDGKPMDAHSFVIGHKIGVGYKFQ